MENHLNIYKHFVCNTSLFFSSSNNLSSVIWFSCSWFILNSSLSLRSTIANVRVFPLNSVSALGSPPSAFFADPLKSFLCREVKPVDPFLAVFFKSSAMKSAGIASLYSPVFFFACAELDLWSTSFFTIELKLALPLLAALEGTMAREESREEGRRRRWDFGATSVEEEGSDLVEDRVSNEELAVA